MTQHEDEVGEILRRMCRDCRVHGVRRMEYNEVKRDMLSFYREFVAGRKPCVMEGGLTEWRGLWEWDKKTLETRMGDSKVTVAVTPNGRADALTDVGGRTLFMRPDEQLLSFKDFSSQLHEQNPHRVLYAQKQNNSFNEEYAPLHEDITDNLHNMGRTIFGSEPEAVNFWMGSDATVSSMHRDHYENLYAVVRGSKTFTLVPPWESSFIPYTEHKEGMWKEDGEGSFKVEPLDSSVKWVDVDPSDPNAAEKYPLWANAHPLTVTVEAGDVLYLPSTWYHEVSQCGDDDGVTIAVNYWWDMHYDTNFWMLEAARRVGNLAKGEPLSDDDE
eukprot:TRINITY_DN11292_c0_g1_i1.p1 TRINITY_DN11292_c0_g1~~TRINITY_DN11292_c0_g1_i1.p1  ORF type:complete len:329 (+),score=81.77 TRINITY_DN11292_c0_g1_i1:99-1085(+)